MTERSEATGAGPATSVRLEPGSHRSPGEGVCIVELASILGGEPFSDRPRCVCRVIGSFLRGWNDRAGYADRQRLHPYASRVVGTGGYRRISRIRRDLCLRWAGADLDRGPLGRCLARLAMRARIAWAVGVLPAIGLKEGAGAYAARVCFARDGSDEAFALLDSLLEIGAPPAAKTQPGPSAHWMQAKLGELAEPNGTGNGRHDGNGNGNGNGGRRGEPGIRATIIARERGNPETAQPRSPGAPGSGSANGGGGDHPRDPRAGRTDADS